MDHFESANWASIQMDRIDLQLKQGLITEKQADELRDDIIAEANRQADERK